MICTCYTKLIAGRGHEAESTWALFVTLVGPVKQFEAYTAAIFSPISTDSLCLGVAQVPRTRDLAIFVRTTDGQPDCFRACARGNNMQQG